MLITIPASLEKNIKMDNSLRFLNEIFNVDSVDPLGFSIFLHHGHKTHQ